MTNLITNQKMVWCLVVLLLGACQMTASNSSPNSSDSFATTPTGITAENREALGRYDIFYVEPIKILSEDRGRLVPATSRELDELASSFREKIIRGLGSRYTQFNQPARNLAWLRITITDVWSTRALTNLRPGLLIPNALQGGASMEAEVIDSVSKNVVTTIRDTRQGKREGFFSGLTKWGGTEGAFDEWALLLKNGLR